MKGVRYLVSEEGKKTHVVLDLEVWKGWEYLLTSSEQVNTDPRHSNASLEETEGDVVTLAPDPIAALKGRGKGEKLTRRLLATRQLDRSRE